MKRRQYEATVTIDDLDPVVVGIKFAHRTAIELGKSYVRDQRMGMWDIIRTGTVGHVRLTQPGHQADIVVRELTA